MAPDPETDGSDFVEQIITDILQAALSVSGGDIALVIHQHPPDCDCGHNGPIGLVQAVSRPGFSDEAIGHLIRRVGADWDNH